MTKHITLATPKRYKRINCWSKEDEKCIILPSVFVNKIILNIVLCEQRTSIFFCLNDKKEIFYV